MTTQRIIPGDCIAGLRTLPDASVHCCVTSPPYWGLRDYGHAGQIGLEATPEAYVARMVEVFREVRRVLREDGTLWLNLGDSYGGPAGNNQGGMTAIGGGQKTKNGAIVSGRRCAIGTRAKDLVGIPWRVAFALQADGWWLRQDIIWHKPNPMPESVRDRCTKAHEYVFLLTKSERYYYDAEAVKEAGSTSSEAGSTSSEAGSTSSAAAWYRRNAVRNEKPAGASTLDGNLNHQSGLRRPGWQQVSAAEQGRNRRSVWRISTKPYRGAHFAVMPPDLVEPCIKAGCPEQCCPACGKGCERVTAKERTATRPGTATKVTGDKMTDGNRDPQRHVTTTQTIGWQPACDCVATGNTPGTVLDPFAGSGTTLAVAAELGRNAVGCELNLEYIGLAEKRIKEARDTVPLFESA
jgi:DNA modification methylase